MRPPDSLESHARPTENREEIASGRLRKGEVVEKEAKRLERQGRLTALLAEIMQNLCRRPPASSPSTWGFVPV